MCARDGANHDEEYRKVFQSDRAGGCERPGGRTAGPGERTAQRRTWRRRRWWWWPLLRRRPRRGRALRGATCGRPRRWGLSLRWRLLGGLSRRLCPWRLRRGACVRAPGRGLPVLRRPPVLGRRLVARWLLAACVLRLGLPLVPASVARALCDVLVGRSSVLLRERCL